MNRKENLLKSFGIGNEAIDDKKEDDSKRRGRPLSSISAGKKSRPTTILLYDENAIVCVERAKELAKKGIGNGAMSDYLNWLINNDKQQNPETTERCKKIFKLTM